MGQLLSGGTTRPASASDLDAYDRMRDQQAKQVAPVLQRRDRPHEYLFIALFDGTGQSAYKDRTLTNIGELKEQAEKLKLQSDRRIGVGYGEGIGTQKNPLTRAIDGAFPHTWDDKIQKVYRDLAREAERWKRQDEVVRTVEAPAMADPAPTPPTPLLAVLRLDDASHPDHALYRNAQVHVHDLDRQVKRTPDQRSNNLFFKDRKFKELVGLPPAEIPCAGPAAEPVRPPGKPRMASSGCAAKLERRSAALATC